MACCIDRDNTPCSWGYVDGVLNESEIGFQCLGVVDFKFKESGPPHHYLSFSVCATVLFNPNKTVNLKYVQRNIEAHSCNHCCSGKAVRIAYSESVFVALVRVHTKLTKQKRNRKSVFCDKFATILQLLWNFLQLVCVFFNSTESRRRAIDQKFSVLLPVSLPADWARRTVDPSQCAEDMSLKPRRWITEETCQLILSVYTVLAAPKNASCFFFFWYFSCEEYKASRSHAYVLIFFIHIEGSQDVLTSLQLTIGCVQDRALKHLENVCVLSDVCVCVWTVVSLLFLFCFRSVFFLICFCLCFCQFSV
jgi:hypothetical protein